MVSMPVSVVIPMYNAERYIRDVLEALFQQDYGVHVEIIVVNDGSNDRSLEIAREFQERGDLKILNQSNQGAVSATNNGFKIAGYDIICSVDSDVVLHKDWLSKIMEEFNDPAVGAVQGYYKTPRDGSFWTRMMGYDVEARYDSILSKYVTQVCTGNTAYRKSALDKTGLFDPAFTYGYDNDMSYRLQKAGYKLVFRKDALCDHYWKADITSYIRQQYNSAYGRMQLVKKHREKITGDSVSGLRMILQVPLTLILLMLLISGVVVSAFYAPARYLLLAALGVLCISLIDRFVFTFGIIRKHHDPSAIFLPFVHLMRNVVWCWAFVKWSVKAAI